MGVGEVGTGGDVVVEVGSMKFLQPEHKVMQYAPCSVQNRWKQESAILGAPLHY